MTDSEILKLLTRLFPSPVGNTKVFQLEQCASECLQQVNRCKVPFVECRPILSSSCCARTESSIKVLSWFKNTYSSIVRHIHTEKGPLRRPPTGQSPVPRIVPDYFMITTGGDKGADGQGPVYPTKEAVHSSRANLDVLGLSPQVCSHP